MIQATVRHLRPTDYRVMPWKNGGGTTTELIIEPAGSSLEGGFAWRLSMADVGTSGPFSPFDGYDRTLLLLEGRGMRLDFQQGPGVQIDRNLEPVEFSGDGQTVGTLLDGPCRDFNVITQRARFRHHLEILPLGPAPRQILKAAIRFLFCASGRIQVDSFELAAMELLRVEGATQALQAQARGPSEAVLIAIGIDPVGSERC
jgi:uncharacterized protein